MTTLPPPTSHSLPIHELLLRDPAHPLVRAQLETWYRALVQQERAIIAQRKLLGQVLGVGSNADLDKRPPNPV